ncbi:MAG: hypothetical protein IK062_03675 [Selenomonadaceae bacterium]|nr:hypothetical protein [Selenomonadaceae bacterium]
MAEIEDRVTKLEEKYSNLHTVVNVLAAKVDAVSNKVDNLISEMRDRDNQRAEEIREIRQKNDALNTKIDEKFEKILTQIQNMAIATVVGVGAIVWAVVSSFK